MLRLLSPTEYLSLARTALEDSKHRTDDLIERIREIEELLAALSNDTLAVCAKLTKIIVDLKKCRKLPQATAQTSEEMKTPKKPKLLPGVGMAIKHLKSASNKLKC